MFLLIFCLLLVSILLLWDPFEEGDASKIFVGILTILTLIVIIFITAPERLGYGRVPEEAEKLTERLSTGVSYQTLATIKDGEDAIILVQQKDKKDVYALRVKASNIPPEHFALVDGKPITSK